MTITYSRPSPANPPKPFQKSNPSGSFAGPAAASVAIGRDVRSGGGGARGRTTVELIGQRPASASEHGPCGGRQQRRILGREPIRGRQEDAPRLAEQLAGGPALQFGSEPLGGLAATLVQDHQVQLQAPTAGMGMPLDELANDGLISGRRDPDQHDGQVARDRMGPQAPVVPGGSRPRPRAAGARGS